jgi:hypothetical protein
MPYGSGPHQFNRIGAMQNEGSVVPPSCECFTLTPGVHAAFPLSGFVTPGCVLLSLTV